MSNKALPTRKRDPENRSEKRCVCGGHNTTNKKRDKQHNSTKRRLLRRKARKFKQNREKECYL